MYEGQGGCQVAGAGDLGVGQGIGSERDSARMSRLPRNDATARTGRCGRYLQSSGLDAVGPVGPGPADLLNPPPCLTDLKEYGQTQLPSAGIGGYSGLRLGREVPPPPEFRRVRAESGIQRGIMHAYPLTHRVTCRLTHRVTCRLTHRVTCRVAGRVAGCMTCRATTVNLASRAKSAGPRP